MEQLCREALAIFKAAVQAVKPENLVHKVMKLAPQSQLCVRSNSYPVSHNVYLVGFGKAVLGMAAAVESVVGEHLVSGIISVPVGIEKQMLAAGETCLRKDSRIRLLEGAHNNMPDNDSLKAASMMSDLVSSLGKNDLLLVLISGGGSALLPSPLPEITLEEKLQVIKLLSAKGATIQELNTVRKRLSTLKGGQLAVLARPARVVSLILSDIINDPLDLIASGPTVPNTDDPELAIAVLEKYQLMDAVPGKIVSILQKPAQNYPGCATFDHVNNIILGSNSDATAAASKMAVQLGYFTVIVTTQLHGPAREVGTCLAELAKAIAKNDMNTVEQRMDCLSLSEDGKKTAMAAIAEASGKKKPLCLLCGGETVVHVKGTGTGGRNQELALAVSIALRDEKCEIVLLSAGTDGIDGPTVAAGAVATPLVVRTAQQDGLEADSYLNNNDSFNFFSKAGNGQWHVITGHTGTNVMDVIVILVNAE